MSGELAPCLPSTVAFWLGVSYKTLLSEFVGTHPEPSHFVRAARAMTVARASRRRVTGTRKPNAAVVGFRTPTPVSNAVCAAEAYMAGTSHRHRVL